MTEAHFSCFSKMKAYFNPLIPLKWKKITYYTIHCGKISRNPCWNIVYLCIIVYNRMYHLTFGTYEINVGLPIVKRFTSECWRTCSYVYSGRCCFYFFLKQNGSNGRNYSKAKDFSNHKLTINFSNV